MLRERIGGGSFQLPAGMDAFPDLLEEANFAVIYSLCTLCLPFTIQFTIEINNKSNNY